MTDTTTTATIGLPVTLTLDPATGYWTVEVDLYEAGSALADLVGTLEDMGADDDAARIEGMLAAWPTDSGTAPVAKAQVRWVAV